MSEIEIPDADGVWTMTDAEFKRELASAWSEGHQSGRTDENCLDENPYRSTSLDT